MLVLWFKKIFLILSSVLLSPFVLSMFSFIIFTNLSDIFNCSILAVEFGWMTFDSDSDEFSANWLLEIRNKYHFPDFECLLWVSLSFSYSTLLVHERLLLKLAETAIFLIVIQSDALWTNMVLEWAGSSIAPYSAM